MRRIPRPVRAAVTPFAVSLCALAVVLAACGDEEQAKTPAIPGSSAPVSTTSPPTAAPTTTSKPPQDPPSAPTTTAAPAAAIELRVPVSAPPIIDGVLEEGEWADAVRDSMSDGATVHIMRSPEALYIAVEGEEIGAVNVLIATDEKVSILHSSAALGSAQYARDGTNWSLSHGFDWCCRSRSDESARNTLFEEEGWQANIGLTGNPGVVEYAVALPWRGAALAISSIRDEADKGYWPVQLTETARDQLLGEPPSERTYNTDQWARIVTEV